METQDQNSIVYIYTTYPNAEEARSIGFSTVKEKLAVSADYWFVNSIYPWKGTVKEVTQCMVMLSTKKTTSQKLLTYIESQHPYEVPIIMRCDTSMVNKQYSLWAESILMNKEPYIMESEKAQKEKESSSVYERLK